MKPFSWDAFKFTLMISSLEGLGVWVFMWLIVGSMAYWWVVPFAVIALTLFIWAFCGLATYNHWHSVYGGQTNE